MSSKYETVVGLERFIQSLRLSLKSSVVVPLNSAAIKIHVCPGMSWLARCYACVK